MTTVANPTTGKRFEIDINEGHYPSEVATNIYNWIDITTNPTKYNQHVLYLGKILVRGVVQKNDAGVNQMQQAKAKFVGSKKRILISECQDFNFANVFLASGQFVQLVNLKNRKTLDVGSGIYFVRMFSDEFQYASKVIVL